MKRTLVLALFFPLIATAQQAYRSPYLADPALLAGYVDSCAVFWTKAYDAQYGGYYTNVGRSGNILNSAKHTLILSTDAYGFVRAFQMTGKQIYLTHARQALQFLYAHSWDTTYGGWYKTLDRQGNAAQRTENKVAAYQHYALNGIAAMFEATRDSLDWQWLMKGYANNDARFWDTRPGYEGYYDYVRYDGTNPRNKSFNSTVDPNAAYILQLYLLTGEEQYLKRMKDLAANMTERFQASMPGQAVGFVEGFTNDWAWDPSSTLTMMGHILKTSWCLARLYELTHDTAYLSSAEQLTQHVLAHGYDHQFGGPFKDYDRTTGKMLLSGIADTAKAWWPLEQMIVNGLILYQITGKQEYLSTADETLDFYMKYFVDHTYGDVYSDRTRYGQGIPAWGDNKGNEWKGAYHSTETGYYTYLYQSLMVAKSTATLYYSFDPAPAARTIGLRPLAYPDYRIRDVYVNDTLLASVDRANSTITLAPGKGGTVRVTFEYFASPMAVAQNPAIVQSFALRQNYPNPFNPATTITYVLARSGRVRISVHDLLGRSVATVVDGVESAGAHAALFNAGRYGLASGTYLCTMETGQGTVVRKMLLLK